MANYVGASAVRYEELVEGELGLRFHNGGGTPTFVNADNQYFGIGCSASSWVFNGFSNALNGCNNNEYHTQPRANCSSKPGSNSGAF